MKKVLSLTKRYDTPEEETAYQRGYSDGFQEAHAASMKVLYIAMSKRKDRAITVTDEELKNIPDSVNLVLEKIEGGRRWKIEG